MAASLILVLNAGSSSLKSAFYLGDKVVGRGILEVNQHNSLADVARTFLDGFRDRGGELAAVGHRVVHGGDKFAKPVRITDDVLVELEHLTPLAPLHEPANIAVIRLVAELFPGVPQVACFDTAFHATMPRVERMFGIPRRYFDAGVKRYGFHGLAYESVVEQLRGKPGADGKLIACHLGSGASLCAIRGGQSIATTMGFTPLDGLLMGTRPGLLDPGAVLYLERHDKLTPDQVDHLLEKESGLLGVSGISADMRELLASHEPAAAEAVELFCYRAAREIGAMATALEGVDSLAFSGGIGEYSPPVREKICARLGWLGVKLVPTANTGNKPELHAAGSRVPVYRVPANEEAVIARQTLDVIRNSECGVRN